MTLMLLVGVLLLASCGGSSHTSTSTTGTSTSADGTTTSSGTGTSQNVSSPQATFAAKADAICRRVNLYFFNHPYKTPQDVATYAPKLAAVEETGNTELAALTAPAAVAHEWRALLTLLRRISRLTAVLGADARANNIQAGLRLMEKNVSLNTPRKTLSSRVGAAVCGAPR